SVIGPTEIRCVRLESVLKSGGFLVANELLVRRLTDVHDGKPLVMMRADLRRRRAQGQSRARTLVARLGACELRLRCRITHRPSPLLAMLAPCDRASPRGALAASRGAVSTSASLSPRRPVAPPPSSRAIRLASRPTQPLAEAASAPGSPPIAAASRAPFQR